MLDYEYLHEKAILGNPSALLKIFRAKPIVSVEKIKVKVQWSAEVPVKCVNIPTVARLSIEVVIQDSLNDLFAFTAEVCVGIWRLDPIEKANEKTETLDDVGASQVWGFWVRSAKGRLQQLLAENTSPGCSISHDLQENE
jgi:hypothetical protein